MAETLPGHSAVGGAAALDNPAHVVHVVAAWRSTASVYADPELLAALRRDGSDVGAVNEPDEPVEPPAGA
ncbi:hypothetical protein [Saccharomonospora cyanea]|uniref:hypothetical protein n=1 Tax=Saccharomonospora cyanea TaxID=40989 RepID=UPI0002F9AE35|nr:hypothetical protein [Saccharomonospora cyanea]